MAFEGMDTEAVRTLAQQLDREANAINSIINSINGIVAQLEGTWKGADATQFQGWWESQHRPALQLCEQAVCGLGVSARNNAFHQDQASSV